MADEAKTQDSQGSDSSRCYLSDIVRFEHTMIILFDWMRCWHRQAGGYTASDTALLLMRAEGYIGRMIEHHPEFECFRRDKNTIKTYPSLKEYSGGGSILNGFTSVQNLIGECKTHQVDLEEVFKLIQNGNEVIVLSGEIKAASQCK